ncbi:MAG: hypothetical protein HKN78_10995 [Sphingomonadaceae bacterium]|nr:hypothetical protein [Sphingomonadaceae bacterium]
MNVLKRFAGRRAKPGPPWTREALLKLFADYVGEKRVDAAVAELGPMDERAFTLPPRILGITFAARSGSTFVGRLLSNAPWFADVNESFALGQLTAIRDRHRLTDCSEATQWMIDNRGTANAFGYKCGFSVLIGAAATGFLSQALERTQFIRLERRDRVAQAVSLLRAEISGRLHSIEPDNEGGGGGVSIDDYDADRIAFNVGHIARNETWFGEILDTLGKPAPVFAYEDICADPAGFVREIGALLDLPGAPDIAEEVGLEILRDEISKAWIDRFRSEQPEVA